MLERRRHDRSRSFTACAVHGGQQAAPLYGVLRDLSAGGARLMLDEPRRAPVELRLALRDGMRPARIVWRGEETVGIAFVPATLAASASAVSAPAASAAVVSLDAARRARLGDEARLAERIARFLRPSRRP